MVKSWPKKARLRPGAGLPLTGPLKGEALFSEPLGVLDILGCYFYLFLQFWQLENYKVCFNF